MCGISGYISQRIGERSINTYDWSNLLSSIMSRGPDSSGKCQRIEKNFEALFCHSRLSIIDPTENSNQPFSEATFNNVLTYNGEIYNYKELIDQYSIPEEYRAGDTLALYYLLSNFNIEKVLKSITGMFSFVFYLEKEKKFIIARDSLGEKPLYIHKQIGPCGKIIVFSSDISSFLDLEAVPVTFNKSAIEEFIDFGFTLDEKTFFNEVHELNPGTYLIIDAEYELHIDCHRYYDFNRRDKILSDLKIEKEIIKSVENCCMADTPIGTFLSGGLDSTLITTLAAKYKNIVSFTVSFDSSDAELKIAQHNAKILKIKHKSIKINKNKLINGVENFFNHITEPLGDDSSFLVSLVAHEARNENIKVLLGGDSGDEFFFGYERMNNALSNMKKFKFLDFLHTKKYKKKYTKFGKFWDLNSCSVEEFYVNYYLSNSKSNWYSYQKSFNGSLSEKIRQVEIDLYLGKNNFKKLDYTTMMYGVEGRTPLASIDLLRKIPLHNVNTKTLRKKIFERILKNENKSLKTISYKSGFGIQENQLIFNYLKDKNTKDKKLLNFFDVNLIDEKFDLSKFIVNFRLYSLSVFLKFNNNKIL